MRGERCVLSFRSDKKCIHRRETARRTDCDKDDAHSFKKRKSNVKNERTVKGRIECVVKSSPESHSQRDVRVRRQQGAEKHWRNSVSEISKQYFLWFAMAYTLFEHAQTAATRIREQTPEMNGRWKDMRILWPRLCAHSCMAFSFLLFFNFSTARHTVQRTLYATTSPVQASLTRTHKTHTHTIFAVGCLFHYCFLLD